MASKTHPRPRKERQFSPSREIQDENIEQPRIKNIAITLLALEPGNGEEQTTWPVYDEMPEQKLVQEFQARRKYTKVKHPSKDMSRDKTVIELGLSGKSYHFGGNHEASTQSNEGILGRQLSTEGVKQGSRDGTARRESKDSRVMMSRLSLPPISPRSARSESVTPFPVNSLLNTDFGFRRQISDSFSGTFNLGRTIVPEELEKELELHAKRHIYACHNLGSIRKGSRAAQNVIGLKQTMTNGFRNNGITKELHTLEKAKSFQRKKPSVVSHKISPSLTTLFPKPHFGPDVGLPEVNGSSLLGSDFNSISEI